MSEATTAKPSGNQNDKGFKGRKPLRRSGANRQLGGVCAGLAEHFDIDVTLVRIVFVVLALVSGAGILLYLLLWVYMQPGDSMSSSDAQKQLLSKRFGYFFKLIFIVILVMLALIFVNRAFFG